MFWPDTRRRRGGGGAVLAEVHARNAHKQDVCAGDGACVRPARPADSVHNILCCVAPDERYNAALCRRPPPLLPLLAYPECARVAPRGIASRARAGECAHTACTHHAPIGHKLSSHASPPAYADMLHLICVSREYVCTRMCV